MTGPSRRRRMVSEINITPFTDVVLVLLIIFMTTTPILAKQESESRCEIEKEAIAEAAPDTQESGFTVDLPRANSGGAVPLDTDVVVMLLEDGGIVFNGAEVTDAELEAKLRALAELSDRTTVVVRADRLVPHWRVVRVLDLAASLGLARFAIATSEE